jgi:hypothetical protein
MWFAFFVEQDVSRLDISMHDAVFVRVMHGARHLGDEFHRPSDGHRHTVNYFVKLTTLDKFHAEIALTIPFAYLVDGNDAWMVKARSGFGFQTKPLQVRLCCPLTQADDFQCNYAVKALLPSTKNDSLPTATNLLE